MHRDPLVLPEVSHSVWIGYAAHPGQVPSDSCHEVVVERWRRARSLGAPLDGRPAEDRLMRGDALQLRCEAAEPVVHAARAEMSRFGGAAATRDFVALLADPAGVVLHTEGGGEFAEEARRVRLIPGASWGEADRGTNAIGTAIAERRPVFVRGNAHYAQMYHPLVCYAAPIFGADGQMVGVLDATSFMTRADDEIGALVVAAAQEISRVLRERALGRVGASVARTLTRALQQMRGVALMVDARGQITDANTAAQALFGDCSGLPVLGLLGVGMAALRPAAHAERKLLVQFGGVQFDLHAEPIETVEGTLIALLLILEARGPVPRGLRQHKAIELFPDQSVVAGGDLATAEGDALRRALTLSRGNLSDAARRLGVARSTLYRMMRRHGLADADSQG